VPKLSEQKLRELREEIDRTDEQLLQLLSKRMELAGQLALLKKKMGWELRDEKREEEVIRRAKLLGKKLGLDVGFVDTFMRLLISGSFGEELRRVGGLRFWSQIEAAFRGYPGELAVVRVLFMHGLRVSEDGRVMCGEMRIPSLQLARAAGTDRRTVKAAISRILADKTLRAVFTHLKPIPHLKDVGKELGWGVLEVIPRDAAKPGIVKQVVECISNRGISIRQVIADDPHLVPEPRLVIITEEPLPDEVIGEIRKLPSVYSVLLY